MEIGPTPISPNWANLQPLDVPTESGEGRADDGLGVKPAGAQVFDFDSLASVYSPVLVPGTSVSAMRQTLAADPRGRGTRAAARKLVEKGEPIPTIPWRMLPISVPSATLSVAAPPSPFQGTIQSSTPAVATGAQPVPESSSGGTGQPSTSVAEEPASVMFPVRSVFEKFGLSLTHVDHELSPIAPKKTADDPATVPDVETSPPANKRLKSAVVY
jgi:hypothetical protein